MKRITLIITIIILSVIPARLGAQTKQYYFNNYQTQSGLPSNTTFRTVQDKNGFIWVSTRDGICRFDGHGFTVMRSDETGADPMAGMSPGLCVDEDGLIWFGNSTSAGCYDPETGQVKSLGQITATDINAIIADRDSCIWFLSTDLIKYDKRSGELKRYPAEEYFRPQSGTTDFKGSILISSTDGKLYSYSRRNDSFRELGIDGIRMLYGCERGLVLASTSERSVILYNPHSGAVETVMEKNADGTGSIILCLMERVEDEFWIGTDNGIMVYDRTSGAKTWIKENPMDSHSISASYVMNLFADREGNVWAGTFYKGLNLWQNRQGAYDLFYDSSSPGSMKGNIVRSIISKDDRYIWIGTEDGELNRYDSEEGTFKSFPVKETFGNIQSVLIDGDQLWIATYGKGLFKYDPAKESVTAHYNLAGNYVIDLLKTMDGDIAAATHNGLFVMKNGNDGFDLLEGTSDDFVHTLEQDALGYIWVGTYGQGIKIYGRHFRHLRTITQNDGSGLLSNHITSFYEDSDRHFWVTTDGGLCYKDPQTSVMDCRFYGITMEDGLPTNVVCSISEDLDGMFWISTTRGLIRMTLRDRHFSPIYFEESQITGNQYSYGASFHSKDGTIYLGTTNGLVKFNPTILHRTESESDIFITGIYGKDEDRERELHEEGRSPLTTRKVTVRSRDITSIRISFAAPRYSNVLATRYEYSFKKGSRNISGVTTENIVSFTGVEPGRYLFNVAIEGSGVSKELIIKIKPPFYLGTVFLVFYSLLLISLILAAVRYIRNKRVRDRESEIAEMENEKQKEIYDAKIKYFTNITHEIRTPLTLIKMPLDKIIASKGYAESSKEDFLNIKSNTDRLLELANQLLDLRKVEQQEKKIAFLSNDINAIVRKSCSYFTNAARERHVELSVSVPEKPVTAFCDADSIEKFIVNLLSNAIKYGRDRIRVFLSEDNGNVCIRVDSNGEPVTGADRERIFEPFFQARMSDEQVTGSKGTGLGLPFSRTLAERHNGSLRMADISEDFNSFVLEFPKIQPLEAVQEGNDKEKGVSQASEIDDSKQVLLIVEDNAEMKYYLGKELAGDFNTLLAANGEEALNILKERKVDLVISDIMMPVMDGCELCNVIKTDVNYCHIPVILLTAAVGVETRIQSLKVGADSYIEKPFSIELLRASIASIFKNREIAFKQFTDSPLSAYRGTAQNTVDNDFMNRLHDEVMKRLADPELSTETLTTVLGTSKSTLYRKIKANTGLNINEYIRLCRLKEAAEMLASHKYRINEVAYLVGFTSPSYFTSSFQKQFNVSPSEFIKGQSL